MASNPFEFVTAVSDTKKDIIKDGTALESEYIPFMVNKALSYHVDSILYANDMNMFSAIPKYTQFTYFLNTLRPRKRFAKWSKPTESELVTAIQEIMNVSLRDAQDLSHVLTKEQQERIFEIQREKVK